MIDLIHKQIHPKIIHPLNIFPSFFFYIIIYYCILAKLIIIYWSLTLSPPIVFLFSCLTVSIYLFIKLLLLKWMQVLTIKLLILLLINNSNCMLLYHIRYWCNYWLAHTLYYYNYCMNLKSISYFCCWLLFVNEINVFISVVLNLLIMCAFLYFIICKCNK